MGHFSGGRRPLAAVARPLAAVADEPSVCGSSGQTGLARPRTTNLPNVLRNMFQRLCHRGAWRFERTAARWAISSMRG